MALTRNFGQFIANLSPNQIPDEATRIARTGFIDCIGGMIAGRRDPCTQILMDVLAPRKGSATLYFSGERRPGPEAAGGWARGRGPRAKGGGRRGGPPGGRAAPRARGGGWGGGWFKKKKEKINKII